MSEKMRTFYRFHWVWNGVKVSEATSLPLPASSSSKDVSRLMGKVPSSVFKGNYSPLQHCLQRICSGMLFIFFVYTPPTVSV